MSDRRRLPNRRPQLTRIIERNSVEITVSAGFDPDSGAISEVFISAGKVGSETAHVLEDAAVLVSVALQHGIPLAGLTRSLARVPTGPVTPAGLYGDYPAMPASMIGLALEAVQQIAEGLE